MKKIGLLLVVLAACGHKKEAPSTSSSPTPETKTDPPKQGADLVELAKNGPGEKDYPDADAVVADERDDITLKADGSVVEHHHSIVRLLDAQRGKEKFADVHVPFDSKRQTLVVNTAKTITDDGEEHAAGADEIGDIVPPQLADATIYSDVRERVVSFPAVDKGSVLELDWTRTTAAGPDAPQGGEVMLAEWDPILSRTVTLTVPEGVTPKWSIAGATITPSESSASGSHTYTFAQANLPDRHQESGSLEDAAVLPRLVYGFAPDWKAVVTPVADRFLGAAIPSPLPDSVKLQADQIVAGAKTDLEKAQKLFAFVAHDVRSIDLPLGWAGYQPHAPDVVLANRYADERDKVGLLLALLSAEQIQGKPVFVRTGKVPVIDSVPTVAQFNRVIAELVVDGKETWVDPADENGQYAVAFAGQDNYVLPIERGGAELGKRPPLDPSTSISHVTASYTLGANGDLQADYQYDLTGWYADMAAETLRPLKGESRDRFFEQSASSVGASARDQGHTVGDATAVTGGVKIGHKVSVAGYSAAQGNFRVFELPDMTLRFADDVPSGSLSERKYSMYVGTPRTQTADIKVAVPAGWKVAYVPPAMTGSTDGLKYDEACEANGQTITCHAQLVLDKIDLPVDKYAGYHEAMAKLSAYERRIVLLTRG
ncbi:MAG TPA: DUF3857 domain-containing protein [Kofleriaceae bacterium]|nr:DUF3857 domain-containing protein [Kofleriaceae bacterium]